MHADSRSTVAEIERPALNPTLFGCQSESNDAGLAAASAISIAASRESAKRELRGVAE
jgi:hypothetical protein